MPKTLSRREFLRAATATAAAAAAMQALPPMPRAWAEPAGEFDFITATEAARLIREKKVSSTELTERMITRIETFDGKINSIVLRFPDEARRRAKEADEATARGEVWGPFHGVPMTIKEMIAMKGVATTSGAPELKDHITDFDATVVTRMRKAGGVILGKTNLPVHALDMQTYNPIYGTTNNPWDLTRTTGGSTGGGAAAVAAGLTYLETGSDIGGSIREPSNFCGVFGHKPTVHVVPKTGFNPPGPPSLPNVLSVCGPLARSAGDLKAAMEVLGGPDGLDAAAYSWKMPPARRANLKEYKVRFVIDDPMCPVVPEVKEQLHGAVEALVKAGATVEEGWPEGINPLEQLELYLQILLLSIPPQAPPPADKIPPAGFSSVNIVQLAMKTMGMNARAYVDLQNKRIQAQYQWQGFFKDYDAFLMPTNFLPAFPHDHSEPMMLRTLETSLGKRAYLDLLYWISFATMTGLPATVAPVGRTKDHNLPVGLQIMGPYLEDGTTIDLAGRLTEVSGGYAPPPGYA